MCFFPLIGLVTGCLEWIWYALCVRFGMVTGLRAAVMTAIPILVTGGIHMDGLLDTCDALSSHKDRDRMLEIMDDSRCGAFAVIWGGLYLLVSYGLFAQMPFERMPQLLLIFVISRSLSGIALVTFEKAKDSGMLKTFSDAAMNHTVAVVLTCECACAAVLMILFSPAGGIAAIVLALFSFAVYKKGSAKLFGGITGDLAGAFLELCELAMTAGILI